MAAAVAADAVAVAADRVGLGWRDALSAGILSHLEAIDIVEVIADDYFRASAHEVRALNTLARQVPMMLHGVAMGLASSIAVESKRVDAMARLVAAVQAECWSEHFAFVRAGGIEIGHLAAPPRNAATVEGAINNIRAATRIVGAVPHLENIATLISPPASTMDEATWVRAIIEDSDAPLLLDLHNLYANAVNFGQDPFALLAAFPLHAVRTVHLSGGVWIDAPGGKSERRLLDDHLHDVPEIVFALLTRLAATAPQTLTIIIERDGKFPSFDVVLQQIARARAALSEGRARLHVRERVAA